MAATDLEEYVRFEKITLVQSFSNFGAAKEYVVSATEKAEELVTVMKDSLKCDLRCFELACSFTSKSQLIRHHVTNHDLVRNKKSSADVLASIATLTADLAIAGSKAVEIQGDLDWSICSLRFKRFFYYFVFFMMLLLLPAMVMPAASSLIQPIMWAALFRLQFVDRGDDEMAQLEHNRRLVASLHKASLIISNALKLMIPHVHAAAKQSTF